jgi:hypothetical protein
MLIALALAAAAPAGIVYLECDITHPNNGTRTMQVALNEQAGTVDYTTRTAGTQRRPASFSADAVRFIGFTLSRVDLSITRPVEQLGRYQGTETGRCRIVQQQARAF